jgi:hypothetical protein
MTEINDSDCEGCNGCRYGEDVTWVCILSKLGHRLNNIEGCPCELCIVKVICNKRCEDFMIFFCTFDKTKGFYLKNGIIYKRIIGEGE